MGFVFVNSMSDLFHERVPLRTIRTLFSVMNENPRHTFQILTKRTERLAETAPRLDWTPNIWMGVTVEAGEYIRRIDSLKAVPSAVRFVSFEPLLSDIDPGTSLKGIDWVIAGGESGPGARPMDARWVRSIQEMSRRDGAAFFFKQWGGVNKKKTGRILDGRMWNDMPDPATGLRPGA
jgi:protein gp37